MGKLGKPSNATKTEALAEAPSVRKDEAFRATKHGLERLQTGKLRKGGKYNRIEEMPYHRITSMSYEERIMAKGSLVVASLGIILVLLGLGLPAISTFTHVLSGIVNGNSVGGIKNALILPDLATISIGVYLLASKFPRKAKEGWWQIKGQGLTADELHGWQVAANEKGIEKFVSTVKEGMSRTRNQYATSGS